MKTAILQMSDQPHIKSLEIMLNTAGYDCLLAGPEIIAESRRVGCKTFSPEQMSRWGYEPIDMPVAKVADVETCDLFVDVKNDNIPKIIGRWPRLLNRMMWCRVNGGEPESDDELPICPLVTANLWYTFSKYNPNNLAYACWMPFHNPELYLNIKRTEPTDPPISICHRIRHWGYSPIIDQCRDELGVCMYGHDSPDGKLSRGEIRTKLKTAFALVHLKAVDCPGWALLEAMLAGCPVIVGEFLAERMQAPWEFRSGISCYRFGVKPSLPFGRGDMDFPKCYEDIKLSLHLLSNFSDNNQRIGDCGRETILQSLWPLRS